MRYVVISGSTNDDTTYIDYVTAKSWEAALIQVSDTRGPDSDGHLFVTPRMVFSAKELRYMASRLEHMSLKTLKHWFGGWQEGRKRK